MKFVRTGKFRLQDASVVVIRFFYFRSLLFTAFTSKPRSVISILRIPEPLTLWDRRSGTHGNHMKDCQPSMYNGNRSLQRGKGEIFGFPDKTGSSVE